MFNFDYTFHCYKMSQINIDVMKQSFTELSKPFHEKMMEFQMSLDKAAQSQGSNSVSEIAKDFAAFKSFVVGTLQCLQQQIDTLVAQVDKSEMRSRRKMLLVHGISDTKDENLSATLIQLFADHIAGTGITENSLSRCHRMGRFNQGKARSVILKFKEVSERDKIWHAKTAFKGTGITISEFLTKDRHNAFVASRKRFGISKCWTKDGIIIILGPDGSHLCALYTKDVEAITLPEAAVAGTSSDAGTSIPRCKDGKTSPSQRSKRIISKNQPKKKLFVFLIVLLLFIIILFFFLFKNCYVTVSFFSIG